jgi:hypothetical protein
VSAPFGPTVSYANITDRLRRAFGLVGDVPLAPKPDLSTVAIAVDLTAPGHATFRGRRFAFGMTGVGVGNSNVAFLATDTVVIETCRVAPDAAGNTITARIMPKNVAPPAGWVINQPVTFTERILSLTDFAPVLALNAWNAAAVATPGVQIMTSRWLNNTGFIEMCLEPVVLTAGDILHVTTANAITGSVNIGGYVF